jgi:Na+/H+ antiporter NhaC
VGLVLFVLLVALILGGLGFVAHVLWIIAVIVFIFWLAGWALERGSQAGSRRRWYRRY